MKKIQIFLFLCLSILLVFSCAKPTVISVTKAKNKVLD